MNNFNRTEVLLDQINECQERYEFERIPALLEKIRKLVRNYRVPDFHFDTYFKGKLAGLEDCAKDLLAPPDQRMWRSSDAQKYLNDYLFGARYALGLMKQECLLAEKS